MRRGIEYQRLNLSGDLLDLGVTITLAFVYAVAVPIVALSLVFDMQAMREQ